MTPDGWRAVKLGDVMTTTVGGGTPSRSNSDYWDGSIPWATVKDFGPRVLHETQEHITEEGLHNSASNLVPANTVVLATRMNVGAVFRAGIPIAINQDLRALIPARPLSADYLYYFLEANGSTLSRLSTGTTVKGLRVNTLRSLLLPLPPLPEQLKIAAILSSLDDAIEKTQAVIDQVQVVKRGLMQQLFTRGLPGRHTRFKQTEIGEIPAEWGLVSLGDIGRWSSGGTPSKKEPRYWAGSIPWVSPKDMKVARLGDAIDHVSDAAIGNGARMTPRDSILIVVRGMILAHTFPVALTLTDVAFNQDMKALVADGTFAPEFLLYWFEDQQARILGLVDTSSHGTKRLPMSKLFAKQVPCPQRDEQEKIAQLLHSHDSYRMAVLAKQAGLVTVKSALMSVLLTGEFRVTPDAEPA